MSLFKMTTNQMLALDEACTELTTANIITLASYFQKLDIEVPRLARYDGEILWQACREINNQVTTGAGIERYWLMHFLIALYPEKYSPERDSKKG